MAFTPRHGKKGMVYLSLSGTSGLALIKLSSWSLSMATDKAETTSFLDTNKTYVQGLKDISGSFTGFWDAADDSLFIAADSADGCQIALYPSALDTDTYWTGPAWLDASIETPVGGAVSVSGDFVANGSWTHPFA